MKLSLLSCESQRPDQREIANCITEISLNCDSPRSMEFTDFLLEGDPVDIEVDDKSSSSALRALRKLSIDYKILE